MMSACGVWCSECPAYHAGAKGRAYQQRTSDAWRRIYDLHEPPETITCGGCLGRDEDLFHASRPCRARHCCLWNGFTSCAECPQSSCVDLDRAQSIWDSVPALEAQLSRAEFVRYARPYCGHRRRIAAARRRQ